MILVISALAMAAAAARAGETFALQTESNRVTLIAGTITVKTHPDSLMFAWRGPYGGFSTAMGNDTFIRLASINVAQNDDQAKRVTLLSHPVRMGDITHKSVAVTLEAWIDRPGMLITVQGDWFFKLCPIHADYYFDSDGEQHAGRDKIPVTPWMFWPTSNTPGGYGIVFTDPARLSMITLYPRADWRAAGWYLIPAAKAKTNGPPPGEAPAIRFWLIPAATAQDVAAHRARLAAKD